MARSKSRKGRSPLITIERKNKQSAEQFRTIRTNINFSAATKEMKAIVITSPRSGDGKSMTACNLAVVYSQEGKKVLLVDADMRKPSVHRTFNIPNNVGLSNYLVDSRPFNDIIQATYLTDLDVVTSGITPPNPSELLSSPQMKLFIKEAKELYDVIIFDTPPVLVVADANVIANQCDGSLLVVRAKKNEVKEVEKAKEQLEFAGAKLIGAILNDKKMPKEHYYYG